MTGYKQPIPAETDIKWYDEALCKDLPPHQKADFFPPRGGSQEVERAKAICAICPVQQQCLDHILTTESSAARYGVQGGMTADERRFYVRALKKAPRGVE